MNESNTVKICGGRIECPGIYKGHIEIYMLPEFYCPDLYVAFEAEGAKVPQLYSRWQFRRAVVNMLLVSAKIPYPPGHPDKEYELCRAEYGMQTNEYCVFEGLTLEGSKQDFLTHIAVKAGCIDLRERDRQRSVEEYRLQMVAAGEDQGKWVALAKKALECNTARSNQICRDLIRQGLMSLPKEDLVDKVLGKFGGHLQSCPEVNGWIETGLCGKEIPALREIVTAHVKEQLHEEIEV